MLSSIRRAAGRVGTPAAVAIAVAVVAAPTGAAVAAAVTKVMITDAQGDNAQVTKANQLQVAEAPATAVRSFAHFGVSGGCYAIAKAPKTQGLVMDQVTIDVWENSSPGSGNYVSLHTDATCTSYPVRLVNPGGIGPVVVEFPHGLGLAPNKRLYATAAGNVDADIYSSGYLVPKSAVPSSLGTSYVGKPISGRYVQK